MAFLVIPDTLLLVILKKAPIVLKPARCGFSLSLPLLIWFLQFKIFIYRVLLCSNSCFYLLYIAFIYFVAFTSLLSVGCWPELEPPPDVLTNQIVMESSTAYCLGQKAALKSITKRNANLMLLQKKT